MTDDGGSNERQRSRFAGGDQAYLKEDQYRDASRLAVRTGLHLKYGTAATPWFDWVIQQARLPDGSLVLDVGCGEGRLWTANHVAQDLAVVGADLSAGMVASTVTRVADSPALVGIHGTAADVQHLPFAVATFDVVFANHMLYHASDPARAVSELARVLRSDGRLVAATNGAAHLAELGEIRARVFGVPPLDDTVAAFGIESGRPILEASFGLVEWLDYEDRLDCTDPEDVIAYLRSVPPGEDATPDQAEQMAEEVRRRFEVGGGVLTITKQAGVFVCTCPV